jgi:hypothetical protein
MMVPKLTSNQLSLWTSRTRLPRLSQPNKARLDNPLPRRELTCPSLLEPLTLLRRGAPGSGSPALDVLHEMKRLSVRLCFRVTAAALLFWLGTYGSLQIFFVEKSPWYTLTLDDSTRASKVISVGIFSSTFAFIFRPLAEIDGKLSGRTVVFSNSQYDGHFHIGKTAEF